MNRRTLIITLASFLGIILVAVLVYVFFIRTSSTGGTQNNSEQPIFGEAPGTISNSSNNSGTGDSGTTGEEQVVGDSGAPPRLHQISSKPVSGAVVSTATSSGSFVRYLERESGHIFQANMDNSETTRITDTTIPRTYEALWFTNPDHVLLRLFDDSRERIQSFLGTVSLQTSALSGTYLEDDIVGVTMSGNGKNIFYLRKEDEGVAGVTTDATLATRIRVFSSPLSEWLPLWIGNSPAVLTKPSGNFNGFLYSINSKSGALERILGDISGLTALPSPDGKRVLYSQTLGSTIRMNTLITATSKEVSTAVSTLPEKCVWSRLRPSIVICAIPFAVSGDTNGVYPDMWYQGRASFSDNLWEINTDTSAATDLFHFSKETTRTFDATSLHLSPKEDYVIFMNKKDLTLWSVRLSTSSPSVR